MKRLKAGHKSEKSPCRDTISDINILEESWKKHDDLFSFNDNT